MSRYANVCPSHLTFSSRSSSLMRFLYRSTIEANRLVGIILMFFCSEYIISRPRLLVIERRSFSEVSGFSFGFSFSCCTLKSEKTIGSQKSR